jgi:hypothetical protein
MNLVWLGQEEKKSKAEQVIDACLDSTLDSDLSTAAAREKAFANGARCSADAYCATYGIPPGACSSIVGPVAEAIADLWSSIFGGDPGIDCAKVSTFDECHFCRIVPLCADEVKPSAGFWRIPPALGPCITQKTKECRERERKEIAEATLAIANRAAAEALQKRRRNRAIAIVAAGAAGGTAWYFWSDITRIARRVL